MHVYNRIQMTRKKFSWRSFPKVGNKRPPPPPPPPPPPHHACSPVWGNQYQTGSPWIRNHANEKHTDRQETNGKIQYVLFFRWDELPVLPPSADDDLVFRWDEQPLLPPSADDDLLFRWDEQPLLSPSVADDDLLFRWDEQPLLSPSADDDLLFRWDEQPLLSH